MSTYVADTHALLWYLFTPEKSGLLALSAFEEIQTGDLLVIPAVVAAEMVMVVERRRIGTTLDKLRMIIASLQREETCVFPPLTVEDILESVALSQIPDIFDRLIVYEAQKRDAFLITKDEVIIKSGVVSTIW